MKRLFFSAVLLAAGVCVFSPRVFSQGIVTAEQYLAKVAAKYNTFRDFEANIELKSGGRNWSGKISFLAPAFLRIDFSNPPNQVVLFGGDQLTVYMPGTAVLTQQINSPRKAGSGLSLALLRSNYFAAYKDSPSPQPLDEGSFERVIKLNLTSRSNSTFRTIVLSIQPDTLMIRRIDGRASANNTLVQFDFSGIRTNVGIPEQRFIYDSLSTRGANVYDNFLLRDD
jgi:outer membrane lipoprotein-sorting protein